MFTPEEFNATMQAFSQPINPLADGSEQFSKLLKSVLMKMKPMVVEPTDEPPFPEPLADEQIN